MAAHQQQLVTAAQRISDEDLRLTGDMLQDIRNECGPTFSYTAICSACQPPELSASLRCHGLR